MATTKLIARLERRIDAMRLHNGLSPESADWTTMDDLYDQLAIACEEQARDERERKAARRERVTRFMAWRQSRQLTLAIA